MILVALEKVTGEHFLKNTLTLSDVKLERSMALTEEILQIISISVKCTFTLPSNLFNLELQSNYHFHFGLIGMVTLLVMKLMALV